MEDVVRVLSTLALRGAVRSLAGRYQAAGGARIDADYAPTLGLLQRLRGGETADVVILTREGLDELAGQGIVVAESCVDLARSLVGIASGPAPVIPISQLRLPCAPRCWVPAPWPIPGSAPAAFSSRS
jgi:hypothetical protein